MRQITLKAQTKHNGMLQCLGEFDADKSEMFT